MKQGDFSTPVMTLQRNLQFLGYGKFIPTGYFGAKTKLAVLSYQKALGLPQTGVFGQPEESRINSELIYKSTISFLGKDASPNDAAPDEYGCADSVCGVLFNALLYPQIKWTVSTSQLYGQLLTSRGYIQVQIPRRGDIIISPTGYGSGKLANGHTGICGDNGLIFSNTSAIGKFEQNYNTTTWKDRYVTLGNFPVYYFRKL